MNSKMATSFLEAASNICSSPTSSKCIIGSVDCRSLRSESICSLGSLVSENQERPKNLCSMSSQGSNASPVTAQTLSLQFHKTRFCPFFAKGHCRKGADCTYARKSLMTEAIVAYVFTFFVQMIGESSRLLLIFSKLNFARIGRKEIAMTSIAG